MYVRTTAFTLFVAVDGTDGKGVWLLGIRSECLKRRSHLKDQTVDGRIILKILLSRHDM
jgi:hypothetical protein